MEIAHLQRIRVTLLITNAFELVVCCDDRFFHIPGLRLTTDCHNGHANLVGLLVDLPGDQIVLLFDAALRYSQIYTY